MNFHYGFFWKDYFNLQYQAFFLLKLIFYSLYMIQNIRFVLTFLFAPHVLIQVISESLTQKNKLSSLQSP